MATRGYRGETHSLRQLHITGADLVFLAVVFVYLVACRWGYPRWF
jgi:energy-coupling factor transporter transmembrane protein EcfT